MIRRNIVSVVAVFAALAVGVAIGGGPLSDLGRADSAPTRTVGASAAERQSAALEESFAEAAGAALTAGRLSGQRVLVVTLPGASTGTVSTLESRVKAAGAAVSGVVAVEPAAVDPSRKTYADTLATRLAAQLRSHGVDGSLPTYQRLGQVLGFSYATDGPATALDASQRTAARTLTTGGLVRASGGTVPATLILVVLPDGSRHRLEPSVLAPLIEGIGGATRRLVAVGDSTSATSGDLATLRQQRWAPWFASVDGVQTTAGQVAATLALARQIGRAGGNFGASGFGGLGPLR